MQYQDLRKLFHISKEEMEKEYRYRSTCKDAYSIELSIGDSKAFLCMDSEIYRQLLRIERLNKTIQEEMSTLPFVAVRQYITSTLIDEIVLTNDIEGVNSSRKEIGDALDGLAKNDKNGRFHGIVDKYNQILIGREVPVRTCEDIRRIYDELVLDEVLRHKEDSAPDGVYFRSKGVNVLNEAGIPIHKGLEPESRITEYLVRSLEILHDENLELLPRIAVFHFLFSYAHPFYDGNGRTNRFISSYLIAKEFSPIVGLKLSHAIKQDLKRYYRAFSMCEHPLNKGDLTPFVIMFNEIIEDAMGSIVESLEEKKALLESKKMVLDARLSDCGDSAAKDIGFVLLQAALFGDPGITMAELQEVAELSAPSVRKRLSKFKSDDLLEVVKEGRKVYYRLNIDNLS